MQASALLLHWGNYGWARNLWVLIIYLFFFPVMLPSVVPRLATDSAVRVFPGVWKLLSFLRLPFQDRAPSLPLCLSFYLLYFFLLLSKTMGCFSGCLMSSDGIQKLFCGIYSAFKYSFDEFVEEKVVSPSYSSTILGPPPHFYSFYLSFLFLTIFVSFVFIAVFPSWHLALLLFSSLCFS